MHFQVYLDKASAWRWRLKSNGRIIADSGQGYASQEGAAYAARRLRTRIGPETPVEYAR